MQVTNSSLPATRTHCCAKSSAGGFTPIFEIVFLKEVQGDWSIRRLISSAASTHRSRRARFAFRYRRNRMTYDANSSSNAFASFRSSVSKPSVNQP